MSRYDEPKQVVFEDPDNAGVWLKGIAYKDEIICSCCGGVFAIDRVEWNKTGKQAIYTYSSWIDPDNPGMYDEELPEGLEYVWPGGKIVESDADENEDYMPVFADDYNEDPDEEWAWVQYFDSMFRG